MKIHDVFINQVFPVGRIREIAAAVINSHSVLHINEKVFVLEAVDEDVSDEEAAVRPGKDGRCKALPDRNIDIRQAVLEVRLLRPVLQGMKGNRQVSGILSPPADAGRLSPVEDVNDGSLHLLIYPVVHGVEAHRRIHDGGEIFSDLRDRESDDRERAFFRLDITIYQQGGPGTPLGDYLRLFFRKRVALGLFFRTEVRLPEGLDHRRSAVGAASAFRTS